MPFQITLYSYIVVGLLIILLGEAFRRAKEKSRAYENLLGVDFKQSGDVFVRTPVGLRHLSSTQASGAVTLSGGAATERPLDRIVSEILPRIAETAEFPQWEIRANGRPIINIELRNKPGGQRAIRKWVVTYVNPVESPAPVDDPY